MHEMKRDEAADPLHRWSVERAIKSRSLLLLPTDDIINPRLVDIIRCSREKADRRTGELGTAVHIECKSSWFTVRFDEIDEARSFARAIADFRDELL